MGVVGMIGMMCMIGMMGMKRMMGMICMMGIMGMVSLAGVMGMMGMMGVSLWSSVLDLGYLAFDPWPLVLGLLLLWSSGLLAIDLLAKYQVKR